MKKQKNSIESPRKKHRGLSVFFTLLILISAGGTVFYLGWIQFRLNAGEYGVIYTKTHGWDSEVLANGEFSWRWEALLPTNLTLHILESTLRTAVINKRGTLPSGELYKTMAGEGVDFGWSIQARVNYRVMPEAFPTLLSQGLGVEAVEDIYTEYESRLEGLVTRLVDEGIESSTVSLFEKELQSRAMALDDRFEIVDTVILDWRYPDRELYEESKKSVLENMRIRQAVLAEIEDARLRRDDIGTTKIELLSRYGEVLSAYPILLDLFSLEGNPGTSLLPLSEGVSSAPEGPNQ